MEKRIDGELTLDELDRVTGGMDRQTGTMILDCLACIPVIGAATQTFRALANAGSGSMV